MKAKILIEYAGKIYRVGTSYKCSSKRDCDLFQRGVCDACEGVLLDLPCGAIAREFIRLTDLAPKYGYKEVDKNKQQQRN